MSNTDVDDAMEELDEVIRRAEKVGDRFPTVNVRHLETIRDEVRDLRSRLEEAERMAREVVENYDSVSWVGLTKSIENLRAAVDVGKPYGDQQHTKTGGGTSVLTMDNCDE